MNIFVWILRDLAGLEQCVCLLQKGIYYLQFFIVLGRFYCKLGLQALYLIKKIYAKVIPSFIGGQEVCKSLNLSQAVCSVWSLMGGCKRLRRCSVWVLLVKLT